MTLHPYMVWTCRAGETKWTLIFNSDSNETLMVKPEKHLHHSTGMSELAVDLMYGLQHRDMLYIVPVYHTDREHPKHFVVEHPPRPQRLLHELQAVYAGLTDLGDIGPLRQAATMSPGASRQEP